MSIDSVTDAVAAEPIKAGLEVASEFILPLPGGSNLVKGDVTQALAHAGLGLVARALLGPIGLLLVSANSIHVALTNRHLVGSLIPSADATASAKAK